MPVQVGDLLTAKHAGSHMVVPTGSVALCHQLIWHLCVGFEEFWSVSSLGGSRTSSWCWINAGSVKSPQQRREETTSNLGAWTLLKCSSPSLYRSPLSLPTTTLIKCLSLSLNHQREHFWKGNKSSVLLFPSVLLRRLLAPFQAGASLKRLHTKSWPQRLQDTP